VHIKIRRKFVIKAKYSFADQPLVCEPNMAEKSKFGVLKLQTLAFLAFKPELSVMKPV
jgi:hypothetical protein